MKHQLLKIAVTVPLLIATLRGQSPSLNPQSSAPNPKTQAMLLALGANSKQTANYQWKQNTTVLRKGSPVSTRLDEVRVDSMGQPHRSTLVAPEGKKMGPLKARKANEIKETIAEVMQFAARYASPQQLAQGIRAGEVWEGQGTLRVRAHGVILPVDEMTMVINPASYLPLHADFKSFHEGSPFTIGIDFLQLPKGPNVMNRITVRIPSEDVVVNVDSLDFQRLVNPSVP